MKQSAVITGGASIIGLAVAERLLDDGWSVAILDVDMEALARAEDTICADRAIFLAVDVTDEYEVAEVFDEVVDRLGLIGGLVNCAAVVHAQTAEETSAELFREIVDVNLVGSFIAAKAALERMGATLSIVNLASACGLRANRGSLAYGASKAGVKLMSEVLALEYGHSSVRVNCVAPGAIESASACVHSPDQRRAWLERIPQARFGEPEEVAAAIAFLLSSEASYINGHTLVVDGGFSPAGLIEER